MNPYSVGQMKSKTYKEHLHDCDVIAILTGISCLMIMLFYKSIAADSFAY